VIPTKERDMSFIKTKDGVEIFYKDWGKGQPLVFSHGWPLSADDWDTQMLFFLSRGYRVIAHDRRGHGRSSQVADGSAQRQERRQGRNHFGGATFDGEERRQSGRLAEIGV
jgi:pimeloyl-ACP methyl ester carboxylesterase